MSRWLTLNADMARLWPNISQSKDPPPDADDWKGIDGKYDSFFTPSPGGAAGMPEV
jgi:ferredoxin